MRQARVTRLLVCAFLLAGAANAATIVLSEDFDSGLIPVNWTVVDNAGTGRVWTTTWAIGMPNFTGGSGSAAVFNSDWDGGEFDTELRTPAIDLSGYSSAQLSYLANYQDIGRSIDTLDLDISTDGGSGWFNLLRWDEDHGLMWGAPGELVTIDLSGYLQPNVMLRWRYYDRSREAWDWYAQIDNVAITADGAAVPEPGTVGLIAFGLLGLGFWRSRGRQVA